LSPQAQQEFCFVSRSAARTRKLGRALAAHVRPGDLLCLMGDLGAGKTTFVQGLAAGLGAQELATSPSFVLLHEYHGRLPVFHLDLYRVTGDLTEIGIDDILSSAGVVVVEWAERLPLRFCDEALEVEFQFDDADRNVRHISMRTSGGRGQHLLNRFVRKSNADARD